MPHCRNGDNHRASTIFGPGTTRLTRSSTDLIKLTPQCFAGRLNEDWHGDARLQTCGVDCDRLKQQLSHPW